jgi:phage repressor protein C with HTH and peptisase S24 domain
MLLEASGDSMAPTVNAGDLALIDLRRYRFQADGLYALREDDSLLIKRLQRRRLGGRLMILSDNPAYRAIELPARAIKIVGQVIWIGKAL